MIAGACHISNVVIDLFVDKVKEKGKVTREKVMENFGLTETQLQTQLATLRHCELVKGHKETDKVYLVPFS